MAKLQGIPNVKFKAQCGWVVWCGQTLNMMTNDSHVMAIANTSPINNSWKGNWSVLLWVGETPNSPARFLLGSNSQFKIFWVLNSQFQIFLNHNSIFQVFKLIAQLTLVIEIMLRHNVLNPLVCEKQALLILAFIYMYIPKFATRQFYNKHNYDSNSRFHILYIQDSTFHIFYVLISRFHTYHTQQARVRRIYVDSGR